MTELLRQLYKAKHELDDLISQLENHPDTVNFAEDRIYNVQARLRVAQRMWLEVD